MNLLLWWINVFNLIASNCNVNIDIQNTEVSGGIICICLTIKQNEKWTLLLNFHRVLLFIFQWNLSSGFFLLYSTITGRNSDRFLLPMFPSIWKECIDIKNKEEKSTLSQKSVWYVQFFICWSQLIGTSGPLFGVNIFYSFIFVNANPEYLKIQSTFISQKEWKKILKRYSIG